MILGSVTIDPVTVASGDTASLTLTLSGPAPPEGAAVSIASGNLSAFPLRPVYLIPAGQSSASFGVHAGTVTAVTTVPVSAGYGGSGQTTTVTVVPPPSSQAKPGRRIEWMRLPPCR